MPSVEKDREVMAGRLENNVSTLMGKARISITELSRKTGISYTTCFDLYHDKSKGVTFEVLSKLCHFFNVTPNDVFTYIPEEE